VQINFDWGEGAPDESLPRDNFSFRWIGLLKPPVAGRYELVVIANAGARLWLDGKLLVDDPALSRRRNGTRIGLDLSATPHPLKIEYWDTTGTANIKLLWHAPGAAQDDPIPPSAFYHDATTRTPRN